MQQDATDLVSLRIVRDISIQVLNNLVIRVEIPPNIIKDVYAEVLEIFFLRGVKDIPDVFSAFLTDINDGLRTS